MMRILCLFDYGETTNTGFASVSRNIKKELKKHFGEKLHLDIVAINFFGKIINDKEELVYQEEDGTFVISAKKTDFKDDDFGRYGFLKLLKENDFDGVFIMQDLGVIQPIIDIMRNIKSEKAKANKKQFKSIFYFPVDCTLIRPLTKDLEFFDTIVTYTNFAKEEVCRFKPELRKRISVVPHGNNNKDFYYVEDREEVLKFKKAYFEENSDKFIIVNVNRNQPRKDIPNTISAFCELKKNWKHEKKPFLYLHMNPKDPLGWDLRAVMQQTDLVEYEDYMFPPKHMENHGATRDTLRMIYNSCDLFITTTNGEGWGLTITEAMSCRLPIVAPNNTSIKEIGDDGNRIFAITEFVPHVAMNDNLIREKCFIDDVVSTMEEACDNILENTELVQKKINTSQAYVRSLDWKVVSKSFIEHFKNTY